MRVRPHPSNRTGSVLVLTAIMMIAMFAFLAFALDLGYLQVVDSEMQRSADAAAIASAWELIDEETLTGSADPNLTITCARNVAGTFSGLNVVTGTAPALAFDDVAIGYLASGSGGSTMCFSEPSRFNAVRARVRKTAEQNGEVSLFFARVLGINSSSGQAEATAAFVNNFSGWRLDPSDPNARLKILPFALDKQTLDGLCEAIRTGTGTDNWKWDGEHVVAGPDEVFEVNLFPQDTGSPGNRGTVDIGSSNNSTCDIARQILDGVNAADLAYHGGSLELNEYGELPLNGDTGISAGVKDELEAIKGEPRFIPIFESVAGNGNNAMYTIVGFLGVRIMEVNLTGKMSQKRVIIQPACVVCRGGIPNTGPEITSHFVYSPVRLVQ